MTMKKIRDNVYRLENVDDYNEAQRDVEETLGFDDVNHKDIESFPCVVVFHSAYAGGTFDLEMNFIYPTDFE